MTVKKEKNGKWSCQFYYQNAQGERIKKHKRGFATKKEAENWANDYIRQQSNNLDMTFAAFVEIYFNDMENRLRENTIRSKRYIVDLKLLPYFGKMKMAEISAAQVRDWESKMMAKKNGYSQTYLRTMFSQLSAIFNYACNYYDLASNPAKRAGTMGKDHADEMNFWTRDEFETFLTGVRDKHMSKMAFLTLYWTGLRIGELLALNFNDIDFENKTLSISKSYQRIDGRDIITEPKTEKGKRVVTLPDFLVAELKEYTSHLYGYMATDRIFHCTKSYLEHEMLRGIKVSGVKRIRLHDLRHSHASLLISDMEQPALLVANRLGHEKIQTTLNTYAHLFPNQNRELADKLEEVYKEQKKDNKEKGNN